MSYASQYRRLEEHRHQLLHQLDNLDYERLNQARSDGGWSAAQVLSHIIDAERKSLAYLHKKIQDPDAIPRRGFRSSFNGWLLALAMKSRFRFQAPRSVAWVVEESDLEALAREWREVRQGWRDFLSSFPAELRHRTVYRHPVAGRLTLSHALRFLVTHLERHQRQIERALR